MMKRIEKYGVDAVMSLSSAKVILQLTNHTESFHSVSESRLC